jgi:hypothetical protein
MVIKSKINFVALVTLALSVLADPNVSGLIPALYLTKITGALSALIVILRMFFTKAGPEQASPISG